MFYNLWARTSDLVNNTLVAHTGVEERYYYMKSLAVTRNRLWGYKTLFMRNSAEHELYLAHEC